MSSFLYYAPDGSGRTSYSYSSGSDFRKCARMFKHKRIDGWMPKDKRAAFQYGIAFESALTFYHQHGCEKGSGVKEFVEVAWPQWKNAELVYSETEGSWEDLLRMGREALALYEVYLEKGLLPFGTEDKPLFQQNYRHKPWPNDDKYGKLTTNAYLDMLFPDLIVDIKTAGKEYPETPKGWPAKDDQLLHYSLETSIRNVAFLVFVKVRSAARKGDLISFLEDCGEYKAGDKAKVIRASGPTAWVVKDEEAFAAYDTDADGVKGKALDELVAKHGFAVPLTSLTKQKIQFIPGVVSDDDLRFTRMKVEETMLDMVRTCELNEYPPNWGVRFPQNHCLSCDFRALCFEDKELQEQTLTRGDLEWLDVSEAE